MECTKKQEKVSNVVKGRRALGKAMGVESGKETGQWHYDKWKGVSCLVLNYCLRVSDKVCMTKVQYTV